MTRLAWLAASLLILIAVALALGIETDDILSDPPRSWAFIALLAAAVAIYFAAIRTVLRDGAGSLGLILGVAVVLRLAVLAAPPFLSSDIYRYVWDGMVQVAGINPYLHVPADPALAALREAAIYPHINRADYAPTIYPPMAQLVFAAVGLAPSLLAMKLVMVGFEGLAVACLLRLLALAGLPSSRVLIYAWNPLCLWEFAGNGHVDAVAIGLIALALLLRARARDGWAGAVLGAAVLVKFLPAVIGPALWRRGGAMRLVAGGLGIGIVLYAAYTLWGGAGWRVLGFLSGYGAEEGLDSGGGIWLLSGLGLLTPLPAWMPKAYLALACLGLALFALRVMARHRPSPGSPADIMSLCGDASILATCLTFVLSPHYAWYYGWLAVAATIKPSRACIWLSAAPILLYQTPFANHFAWPALVFVPALVLAYADGRRAPASLPLPAAQGST